MRPVWANRGGQQAVILGKRYYTIKLLHLIPIWGFFIISALPAAWADEDLVYVRKATREATRQASLDATREKLGSFRGAPWMLLTGERVEDFANTRVLPGGTSQFAVRVRRGTNRVLMNLRGGPTPFFFDLSPLHAGILAALDRRLDADFPSAGEQAYYRIETIETPPGAVFEVGGLAFSASGTLMTCTRRGTGRATSGASSRG